MTRLYTAKSSLLILILLLFSGRALAQLPLNTQDEPEKKLVVRDVDFENNKSVKNSTLYSIVRTRTNREFFSIPRFTPWYFLWNLNINIGKRLGESPAYLDRRQVGRDIERIKTYYRSNGYRDVEVDTTIKVKKDKKALVTFTIQQNEPYYIASITYNGLPSFPDTTDKRQNFFKQREFEGRPTSDSSFAVNIKYNSSMLGAEQDRLIKFMRNNGYASVQTDSVNVFLRPDNSDDHKLHALFLIFQGDKYKFGDIYLRLADNRPPAEYDQNDSLNYSGNKIIINKEKSSLTKQKLLVDQLRFSPGDTFDQEAYRNTINDFQNLGMLSVQKFGLSEDAGTPDYSGETVPVALEMNTLPRQSFRMEVFGLQRFGLGVGSGVTYTNNNLFQSAERLEISANGTFEFVSEQAIDRNNLTNVENEGSKFLSALEGRIDYSVPRLNFPLAAWNDKPFFRNSRTRYSIAFSSSDQLNFDINSDILLNLGYQVRHDQTRSSTLDLIELEWLEANPTNFFINSLEDQFSDEDNSLELNRILEDFRSQFSSIIRYTYRNIDTDIIKRNSGEFEEYSFSLGGNIPFLIDNFIVTPDTVESTIPGVFGISGNRLSYAQFFKLSLDYRKYYPLRNENTIAIRAFGGFVHPYGKNTTIPLNRRFFAGGSNDIRGYAPNNLGPGKVPPANVTINGGEIKLATFVEYRNLLFEDVLSAKWFGALFTDAGNIWYGPRNDLGSGANSESLERGRFKLDEFHNQIAVSSGFGLRVDWQFVIMRFDFTRRIHDLQDGWFENKNLFFTFGIGHSF